MTLRLVGKDPPKRQKDGPRHETIVLSPDEQRKARQALRNLKDHFGTCSALPLWRGAAGLAVRSRRSREPRAHRPDSNPVGRSNLQFPLMLPAL
jgi:hypothetical protein